MSGMAGTAGNPPNCAGLVTAPVTPTIATDVFSGSEDLAFDNSGHLVARDGSKIIAVDSSGVSTQIATGFPGTVWGLRYTIDGTLVVASPDLGSIRAVSPGGVVTDFVTGLDGPNGVYPDLDGNLWITDINANRVLRRNVDGTIDDIVTGSDASSANGVVYDPSRKALFYTNYSAGRVLRVAIGDDGAPGAITIVATIAGTALDGLVEDACGNIYAMDNGNSAIYRLKLDTAGDLIGDPELLASFVMGTANAQFGRGAGWDPTSLYVTGTPGVVYKINVGVTGAPIPLEHRL